MQHAPLVCGFVWLKSVGSDARVSPVHARHGSVQHVGGEACEMYVRECRRGWRQRVRRMLGVETEGRQSF